EIGELAADRQAEPGAAILAARARIGLLKRLEDDPLFFQRNANTRVAHLEGNDRSGRLQNRVFRAPAAPSDGYIEPDTAVFGELEGVRKQVLEHLLQALDVSNEAAAKRRIHLYIEGEAAVVGLVPEGTFDHFKQVGEVDLLRFHRYRTRFDFRQIQNVTDQIQKIGSGSMDGPGELDLLACQVPFRVFRKLLPEDQNAVQRRAKLVRHVRQEFGLIF